jgi:aldehyde:ferredoxin oxidoreductase
MKPWVLYANCANTNLESINMASHICNSYGMDTISAGVLSALPWSAMKMDYRPEDTDGIELTGVITGLSSHSGKDG